MALNWPGLLSSGDEGRYVRQAVAFSQGETLVEVVDAYTGVKEPRRVSIYPPGTSAVMAPFVAIFGWRGAFAVPALSMLVALFFTALCIQKMGGNPLFEALVISFPVAIVMSRVATSDMLSGAVAAMGWWAFWSGAVGPRRALSWFVAGLIAGLSLLIRESNLLPLLPLFPGALIRRDPGGWWLVLGGLVGCAARLGAAWLVFGDPLFLKISHDGFSLEALAQNAPVYLTCLVIGVPGGLVLGAVYRGPRRLEVVATILIFVGFYLSHEYGAVESGAVKRWVLGPRFFLPLLPVLAFAMAESVPRLLPRLKPLVLPYVSTVCLGIGTIHPVMAHWGVSQARVVALAREHVPSGSPVFTNLDASNKMLNELTGFVRVGDLSGKGEIPEKAYVVFLERTDSSHWRKKSAALRAFPEEVEGLEELSDEAISPTDRLWIFQQR